MQAGVRDLLERRMKKTLAIILGMKERDVDPYLPDEVSDRLRSGILREMNNFLDLVLDVVDTVDDDSVVVNEVWLDKIDEIWTAVVERERVAAGG